MPEFVDGLPLHALVLHAVVVLVPLTVLGAVVIAVWPAARRRFGWLVVAFAAASVVLTPITTSSGNALARRLPENPQIATHQQLGEQLIWFVLPLFLAVTALMVVHTLAARGGESPSWTKIALVLAAVASIGLGVASGVHVFRVGDAGSRAVWEGIENLPAR
ncbi:DUF2231 domain-containing protein [Actinokineospora iranica]|uniref:DUF2231 domain-containing protein n=1 Tax=Actinokineospora iranica TaxID=1271860 RepID=A0A1G6ILS6_9PSEU|nr:DUF2231 domain-containing protein [Actinokineospora iranica]SDC07380.1 hypothetical protein SAMN05216174_1017 [Actinokineospora iranica]